MTPLQRSLAGFGLGAACTLAILPATRPFFRLPIEPTSGVSVQADTKSWRKLLPNPTTLSNAAIWAQHICKRVNARGSFSFAERQSAELVLRRAAAADPENSFWPQVFAVYLSHIGQPSKAAAMWKEASGRRFWMDFQTEHLLEYRPRLAWLTKGNYAWHLAYLTRERSLESVRAVERYARRRLGQSRLDPGPGIELRFQTIRNGDLIRKGAGSIAAGRVGADLVDLAAYPPELTSVSRPKRLILGRTQLINGFLQTKRPDLANEAFRIFRNTDGWTTLLTEDETEGQFATLAVAGVAVSILPAAMVFAALNGGILLLAQLLRTRLGPPRASFAPAWLAVVALAASGTAWLTSRNFIVSAVLALAVMFLGVTPEKVRRTEDADLGPLFAFVCGFAAVVSLALVSVILFGISTPGVALLAPMDVASETIGNPRFFAGLLTIVASVICLIAPLYAVVYRVPTPKVFGQLMQRFSRIWLFGGVGLALIGTGLSVAANERLEAHLGRLLQDEPVYYLSR